MSYTKHLVPICIIYIDGVRLSPVFEGAFRSVTVIDKLNGISQCTVTFEYQDIINKVKDTFPYLSNFSLHLGYKDETKEVFNGEITKTSASLPEFGSSLFSATASSCLQRLNHGDNNRIFENKSPSAAVKDILSKYNLQADCDSFGTQKAYWEGGTKTDLELVLELAKQHGKDVYAFGDKVYVKELMTHMKDEAIYEWGKTLSRFEAKLNIEEQASEICVFGWNMREAKDFRATVKAGEVGQKIGGGKDWTKVSKAEAGQWDDYHKIYRVSDSTEAREVANALMREKSFKLLRAEGSGEGNCKLSAGMIVTVKYVGTAYSGDYIADVVIHRFSVEAGYTTEFYLKRNMLDNDFMKGTVSAGAQAETGSATAVSQTDDYDDDEEDGPEFRGLKWLKDGKEVSEALVDDKVVLTCEVKNIADGETVKFKIFEQGENKDDSIDELTGTVKDGEVEASWKVVYKENANCTQEIEEQGWTVPDYYFVAEYAGVESEQSKKLDVKGWVCKQLLDEDSGEPLANIKYTLSLPDNTEIKGTTDENGYMGTKHGMCITAKVEICLEDEE